jgi:hypothetical protein
MKYHKLAVLSAVAAVSFAGLNASAQLNYNQGDLLLGFRNPTAGNDMVVDIGTAGNLVAAATAGGGSTSISGAYYTSSQFTASGLNFDNLYFSVFGDTSGNTLWATASSPLGSHSFNSQGIAAGQFEAIASGAQDTGYYGNNAANSPSAVIMPNSFVAGGGTDLSYTKGVIDPNSGVANFAYFPVPNEANTVPGFDTSPYFAAVNLYQIAPLAATTQLGYFDLMPNGSLTFNLGVAPVPEPTTWAMLGAGLLALTAVRRMKNQK